MLYSTKNSFIIDNVVVTNLHQNGISLTPISLLIKRNINVSHLEKKKLGTRKFENYILSLLSSGKLNIEDL